MTRRFLFIHQNFPGQFVHVAAALARQGHDIVALGIHGRGLPGVRFVRYRPRPPERTSDVELVRDFETKVLRGSACAEAMAKLRQEGFIPDTIVAHPGWGEALFCKDVWPDARLIVFGEFYYSANGADYNFDPEFAADSLLSRARLRIKNTVHLHALEAMDAGYTPTRWQLGQLPRPYRDRFEVIFDGIDTDLVCPNPSASLQLRRDGVRLAPGDEVITFVNRNLEPYRGFHVFMRALPEILRLRPAARCLIIGGDDVSYGFKPSQGGTWREVMLAEVGTRLPMDRVHFLGRLPYADYLRVLQVSACHVYLTYPFVLSWSCVEAMAAGCAVVASATEPVREVIEHDVDGVLFDFFDQSDLVRLVAGLLGDPARRARLGASARDKVLRHYDLRSVSLPRQLALLLG